MSAQKGNVFVPLLAIIALIAIAAAGFFFWQNQQIQNQPLVQSSNRTPTSTPAATTQGQANNSLNDIPSLYPKFDWEEVSSLKSYPGALYYYDAKTSGTVPLPGKTWEAIETYNNRDELSSKGNWIFDYYDPKLTKMGYTQKSKIINGLDVSPINASGPTGGVIGYMKTSGKLSRVVVLSDRITTGLNNPGPFTVTFPATYKYEVFVSDVFELENVLP